VWLPKTQEPAPLVVLSHGSGGHYNNLRWLVDALTANGYIVAAVNHPFNTARNNTPEGIARAWDRPPDLSLLIDELLAHETLSSAIDGRRIGAAGFSSGGYTVIALGGAIFDIDNMHEYCRGASRGPECELSSALPESDADASRPVKDTRVTAVFAMAPAWGAATTAESLSAISVPVKIVATADDEWLKPETHAKYFNQHIPTSDIVIFPKGGHFLFLSCDFVTRIADRFIKQFNLCGAGVNIDRQTRQREVAGMAVEFFDRYLRASE
jgi:predicted dienelactone hydrolase